jgi:TolA-binding protein
MEGEPVADQEILSGLGVIAAAGIAYLARALKSSKQRAPEQLKRMRALASAYKKLGLRVTNQEDRIRNLEEEVSELRRTTACRQDPIEENS